MVSLRKLQEASAKGMVNLISKEPAITLKASKEGQYWRLPTGVSGTIPLSSHNAKNLEVARIALIAGLQSAALLGP
jgi:hypothetical protein